MQTLSHSLEACWKGDVPLNVCFFSCSQLWRAPLLFHKIQLVVQLLGDLMSVQDFLMVLSLPGRIQRIFQSFCPQLTCHWQLVLFMKFDSVESAVTLWMFKLLIHAQVNHAKSCSCLLARMISCSSRFQLFIKICSLTVFLFSLSRLCSNSSTTHTHTHTHTRARARTLAHTCTHAHARTHTHARVRARTHTHTHTHTVSPIFRLSLTHLFRFSEGPCRRLVAVAVPQIGVGVFHNACLKRWSWWVSVWSVCFDWHEACLLSWCNRKHDGRIFQRYRFESRRRE